MSIFIGGPPGLTWEGARSKVRGDLWRPGNSLPDDVVDRALHASILELEGEASWLWLENLTTLFTLDGDMSSIAVPATVGRVSSLAIVRATGRDDLLERPLSVVRENADRANGYPGSWAFGPGCLYLDSHAPAGVAFEAIFTASTPEVLEEALDAPSFTLGFQQQAVIANACAMAALSFMKNEAEAARQRAVYDRILTRLHSVEADRRGAAIQPDTWGMRCG